MTESIWNKTLRWLESDLAETDINTWLRPLKGQNHGQWFELIAPNQVVLEQVKGRYHDRIMETLRDITSGRVQELRYRVGDENEETRKHTGSRNPFQGSRLNNKYIFDSFVRGQSNQIAKAAAEQVAANPGQAYNPLLICGSTGLGKTHLMHAIGNALREERPGFRVVFLAVERFVHDMVNALRHDRINEFKDFYRSVNTLLIDDIHLFANKERTQEEFFHTFNALLEDGHQIVMTSDKYPRELDGIDERLKSRFAGGMTVFVEPPELETRAAILLKKAELENVDLSEDVAFFVAERIRSHVRELEAALKTLKANHVVTGDKITIDFARMALRHMLSSHDKVITIENIQKKVADFYNIRRDDLISKSRRQTVARPRQMAMALCKELTRHSLPEIGDAFGGRDHTTVLHGCRKIAQLCEEHHQIREDFKTLQRSLNH
ncbi:MAG: chromosomal replication initiator protein DnaA [Oceanococcus sp.]